MSDSPRIVRATREHSSAVAALFDKYRQFYDCNADLPRAEQFIRERIAEDESVIFVAEDEEQKAMGFVQMYPSFCSVEAVKILILYDLFVDQAFRKRGVGEALMNQATAYAKTSDAARLDLLTAKDNQHAQSLYAKIGYERTNEDFYAYSLNLQSLN